MKKIKSHFLPYGRPNKVRVDPKNNMKSGNHLHSLNWRKIVIIIFIVSSQVVTDQAGSFWTPNNFFRRTILKKHQLIIPPQHSVQLQHPLPPRLPQQHLRPGCLPVCVLRQRMELIAICADNVDTITCGSGGWSTYPKSCSCIRIGCKIFDFQSENNL